jgi:predicted DNA-binding transcriptional regulator AlpA
VIEKVMLDVQDVMALTGIGRNNAYELMRSGEFPVRVIGKRHFVHKEVFDNWLKEDKTKKKAMVSRRIRC